MFLKITNTTDGKHIGLTFDSEQGLKSSDGNVFYSTDIKEIGGGYVQISNSNYIIITKKI